MHKYKQEHLTFIDDNHTFKVWF